MAQGGAPFEIAVVGGAGHVGAPLAIVFASKGHRTLIHDVSHTAIASLARGAMPFIEEGAEPLLKRALEADMLGFSVDPAELAGARYIVVTIGTPIDEFHNPKTGAVTRCIDGLMPYLSDGQTLILRSTLAPGVTDLVDRHLRRSGKHLLVAFCPERVVQGKAVLELQTLPQIVSGTTPEAEDSAAAFFAGIAPSVIRMSPREAEFAKLISNAYRYVQFAAANQFYMMVESAGLDYQRVLAGLKQDYPRMRDLPGPGFAAGPCLMKDTMQLGAFDNSSFPLGNIAMLVNEGLPNFLVERLRASRDLATTRVGILGMAFKADIDDIRESLSYKLGKILRLHGTAVRYSDEFAKDATFVSAEELLRTSDVVIVGVPHSAYRSLRVPVGIEVVDLWNVLPTGRER